MIKIILFLFLFSSSLWASISFDEANQLLKDNTLDGKEAGVIIPNTNGDSLVLVTNFYALKKGAKIVSVIAIPPDEAITAEGEMVSKNGADVGHTAILFGHYGVQETSYSKYPAHNVQLAFLFSTLSREPIAGEIRKKPADYLERRKRSKNDSGITFLLNDEQYLKMFVALEKAVREDQQYRLNCDNCSSWAVKLLKVLDIDFDTIIGKSDATPWKVTTFADSRFADSNILRDFAKRYFNGIFCANPLDMSNEIKKFYGRLGINQVPLKRQDEELSAPDPTFMEQLGKYIGLSLKSLKVGVNTSGSINVATEGAITNDMHTDYGAFSFLDFEINTDLFNPQDPIYLNKALASVLKSKLDMGGVVVGGNALSVLVQENGKSIEVYYEWLRLKLQISFYVDDNRKLRFMIKGSAALQSAQVNGIPSNLQIPFDLEAAVQLGQLILSYAYDSKNIHTARLEFEITDRDSVFIEGNADISGIIPRYWLCLGYRLKL
jgi:hypothetical protein